MKILLAITFVFGVLTLLTHTKLFNTQLELIFSAVIPHNGKSTMGGLFKLLGIWFFYFSLCFQAWYWLFN